MNANGFRKFELHPALRQSLFITGTDTEVGKTWVTTRLLKAWVAAGYRAAGMKPVAAGVQEGGLRNEDAMALQAAGNVSVPYEWINPVLVQRPTSPHLGLLEESIDLNIESILDNFNNIVSKTDLIAVEGAGGWLTPLTLPDHGKTGRSMADVALALGLPVLLVVPIRLGALSHALLTSKAITASGLPFAGWLANRIDPDFGDFDGYCRYLEAALPGPRVQLPA